LDSHPGCFLQPPTEENTAHPQATPRVDIDNETTEVLDRLLKASDKRTDPAAIATARAWLHGYVAKLAPDKDRHPPDNRIVAQFLAIAEWPRLEHLLKALFEERQTPGYSYAWFLTVALQRLHGIQPARLKTRRAQLKLVRSGAPDPPDQPQQTANPEWSAQLLDNLQANAK
jgi:hypothetical protein